MLFHSVKRPIALNVVNLNQVVEAQKTQLQQATKANHKSKVCQRFCLFKSKENKQQDKKNGDKTVFVLDFVGDIKASAVERLREEISAVITSAKAGDEVVVRLESAGGQVHGYGLAAAQLERIRQAGLTLTICVDKVAASGGYMMACVADKVLATPFAIVGSIGVVSQMPNFHEWLKKHDIDVELFTAGEYKRTVTMFGKNEEADRAKYQSELERIHELFKQHVAHYRPALDMSKVATGEFWFGHDAKALGLVDEFSTSDAYILAQIQEGTVLHLHAHQKPNLMEKLGLSEMASSSFGGLIDTAKDKLVQGLTAPSTKLNQHVSL